MGFNFGNTAFKFPPPKDFTALFKASKDSTTESKLSGGGGPAVAKAAPNAPQAIILEPSRELAEQVSMVILKCLSNYILCKRLMISSHKKRFYK